MSEIKHTPELETHLIEVIVEKLSRIQDKDWVFSIGRDFIHAPVFQYKKEIAWDVYYDRFPFQKFVSAKLVTDVPKQLAVLTEERDALKAEIHSIQRTHRNLQDSWELKNNRLAELEGEIMPHFASLNKNTPIKDLTNAELHEYLVQLKTYPYAYGDSLLRAILSEVINRNLILISTKQ